jgi:hypothetical protein
VGRLGTDQDFTTYSMGLYENYRSSSFSQKISLHMQMPVFTSIMRNAKDTNVLNEFMDIYSNMENNEEEENYDENEGVKEALGEAFDEELIAKVLKLSLKVKNRFYVETFKTFK